MKFKSRLSQNCRSAVNCRCALVVFLSPVWTSPCCFMQMLCLEIGKRPTGLRLGRVICSPILASMSFKACCATLCRKHKDDLQHDIALPVLPQPSYHSMPGWGSKSLPQGPLSNCWCTWYVSNLGPPFCIKMWAPTHMNMCILFRCIIYRIVLVASIHVNIADACVDIEPCVTETIQIKSHKPQAWFVDFCGRESLTFLPPSQLQLPHPKLRSTMS